MQRSKKALITFTIAFVLFFLGMTVDLPYYIYKPGQADELDEMVEVVNGHHGEGHLHLVTVSGAQATPFEYITAKILPYHEVIGIEEARPEGMTDEEYMTHQLHLMENSQHASMVVAYESAGAKVNVYPDGVYVVSVIEDMPADGILQVGDKITKIDESKVTESEALVEYVQGKQAGTEIDLTVERDGNVLQKRIEVTSFEEDADKVGIGVQLVTNEEIEVDPEVEIKSGKIGGPSAGLMFTLEMYNQLTDADITKGYNIAGTGEIDVAGNIHRIGGIDKKIVAADKKGVDIFFAPNEKNKSDSNYEVAKETAAQLKTDMEIVPVDTFDDALQYLEELAPN